MASRRSSRSREDYRRARDLVDLECRPVLCIRDDDCEISLKSYGGSEVVSLNDIQNCVSGGPLKEACQLLLRQLNAFSQSLFDRVSRVAVSPFDEIRFVGDNSHYEIWVTWPYGDRHGSLIPSVYIRSKSGAGSLSLKSGKVSIGAMPRNPGRVTWTTVIGAGVVASMEDVRKGEMILSGLYRSGRLRGDIEYNARKLLGGQQTDYLDGGLDRMTLRFGRSRDQVVIPP